MRWLDGYSRFDKLVDAIRNENDKDRQKELKKDLPCITPSGQFASRHASSLVKHSGFIAIDFDNCDPGHVKNTLRNIANVFYAGLSASGRGIWALIPVSYPSMHLRQFEALKADFKCMGLEADPACSDVSRLRFYSYDRDPVFNKEATAYNKLSPQDKFKIPNSYEKDDYALELLIEKIEAYGQDITVDYLDWVKIGGALASVYGKAGRELFHRFSQFYPKYSPEETDRQFNVALNNTPGYGVGIIFEIAKQNNFMLKYA